MPFDYVLDLCLMISQFIIRHGPTSGRELDDRRSNLPDPSHAGLTPKGRTMTLLINIKQALVTRRRDYGRDPKSRTHIQVVIV